MGYGASLLLGLGFALLAPDATDQPAYAIAIDERVPRIVRFSLSLPGDPAVRLVGARLTGAPRCGGAALIARGDDWLKPAGCGAVTWTAQLAEHDVAGIDATDPDSVWSARNRLWVLSGKLPWLRTRDQSPASANVRIKLSHGQLLERRYRITPDRGAPLVLTLGAGKMQRYVERGLEIRVMGDVPAFRWIDPVQRRVAHIWLDWRRDVLPPGGKAPPALDIAWVQPRAGAGSGFFASANSDAVLMQYSPDPADPHPEVKLRTAIMLVGAHEGFHMLLAGIPGERPAWINESWASYFAYAAARDHLTGNSRAHADALIAAPTPRPLLEADRRFDKGEADQEPIFYSKGARFWMAIEKVLAGPANRSGKLAALIQSTEAMRGLDWRDAEAVAAFLDRHSGGRAGSIVRCYLVVPGCTT